MLSCHKTVWLTTKGYIHPHVFFASPTRRWLQGFVAIQQSCSWSLLVTGISEQIQIQKHCQHCQLVNSLFSGQLVRLCCNDLHCYNPLHCGFVFWSTQGHPQRSRCAPCAPTRGVSLFSRDPRSCRSINHGRKSWASIDTMSFFWQHILQGTY